jgi:hypothetical protein
VLSLYFFIKKVPDGGIKLVLAFQKQLVTKVLNKYTELFTIKFGGLKVG